mmetsp:Transcript_106853/g.184774  ORF Transcript_106853/g.184774 Transcript_106853/m.184774 type:complete len:243 (+) Transcript_106853:60-788(+)
MRGAFKKEAVDQSICSVLTGGPDDAAGSLFSHQFKEHFSRFSACSSAAVPVRTARPLPPQASAGSQAMRKRQVASPCNPQEDSVENLLPKLKRMRLRPSLGQLRLQREASDAETYPLQVRLCVEPEQLRATVSIALPNSAGPDGGDLIVHFELIFPPQYPHKAPKLSQVSPEEYFPLWEYDGRFIVLKRLTERGWSPAMGVADIIGDLLQALGWAEAPLPGRAPVTASSFIPALSLDDVEMA